MKTIGVLGGMSSVATAEYYRLLNAGVNAVRGGHTGAELLIYSVNFAVIEECIRLEEWDRAGRYLAERAQQLERGGADFLLLATNTLHRVAEHVTAAIGIPFVHIIDTTAQAARDDGAGTLGLLGTAPVMEADFYRQRFAEHGIDLVVPSETDRALINAVIFNELTRGQVEDRARHDFVRIIDGLIGRGAQGIVLGCTELGLLLSPADVPQTKLYDTTALHVERAVQLSLELAPLPQH